MSDEHLIESKIDSQRAFDGKLLHINVDTVRLPDGSTATREYTVHPGAVMVIPLFEDQTVLIERQFRYPVGAVLWEFPAGKIDAGEDPLTCAKRELLEETGFTAQQYQFLTRINPVISYSTEFIDLYLATGLQQQSAAQLDIGEFLECVRMPVQEVYGLLQKGDIPDVKTHIGVFWLRDYLQKTTVGMINS